MNKLDDKRLRERLHLPDGEWPGWVMPGVIVAQAIVTIWLAWILAGWLHSVVVGG